MALAAAWTQKAPRPDRPVPPVRVGSVFGGGPSKLGVPRQPPKATGLVPGGPPSPSRQAPPRVGSFAPQPPTGPAPTVLKGPPGGSNSATQTPAQQAAGPSPLDSTYFANVASNQFQVGNKINALNEANAYGQTDLAKTLANYQYQQPRALLAAERAAAANGALYSTGYGQQLGDIGHQYLTNEGNAQDAYARQVAQRNAEIQGLQGSIPLYNTQQAAAAAVRAAQQNAANKALGEPTSPLVPSKPVTPTAASSLAAALATAQRTGKAQRTQAGGRTVISRPSGSQQATRTSGGMFGGTVRLSPAAQAALLKLVGGK